MPRNHSSLLKELVRRDRGTQAWRLEQLKAMTNWLFNNNPRWRGR